MHLYIYTYKIENITKHEVIRICTYMHVSVAMFNNNVVGTVLLCWWAHGA